MILVVDNYDSFVHNLARYMRVLGRDCRVVRNDAVTLDEIAAISPSHIVISPGPCTPNEAGISNAVIGRFAPSVPILGVCLGHQCIGQVFGGRVVRAHRPVHGKTSMIGHDGEGVFRGLARPLRVARYHSLAVADEGLPDALSVTARSEDGQIMGLRHRDYPVTGVQFHPEAILTESGYDLLRNFLEGTV